MVFDFEAQTLELLLHHLQHTSAKTTILGSTVAATSPSIAAAAATKSNRKSGIAA
jgi:hypothetical protein